MSSAVYSIPHTPYGVDRGKFTPYSSYPVHLGNSYYTYAEFFSFCLCCAITSIHSFSSLSYDKSKASSKASSPHSAIQSFLLQMRVSSPFLKVIQQLPTSSSLSSCHFYHQYIIIIFIFITEIRKTSGKLLRELVKNWLIIKQCIIQMHYPVMNVLDQPAMCQFLTNRFSVASKHFIPCMPCLSRPQHDMYEYIIFLETIQIMKVNQVATIQVNLLFLVSSTCFGRCFRPSSGALDCIYSIWQYSPKLLPVGVLDELKLLCSFNSSKTPADSNLGEYYQIL